MGREERRIAMALERHTRAEKGDSEAIDAISHGIFELGS
jgi:hypothetical protein